MSQRQLAQFEILARLGAGGMGVVYRARDRDLDRLVALKVLVGGLEGSAGGTDGRQRLLAEARAASKLNHPGIVTVYQVGCSEDVDFIAMELVEGETLAQVLGRGPVPCVEALEIAIAIADAVDFAHEHGIVHRDLKPDNIMVAGGRVKVLDFGLSKRLFAAALMDQHGSRSPTGAMLTEANSLLGTPAYMSPEQAQGLPVDHRSDIFSLGCVVYEMVTGERPFRADNLIALLGSILRDPMPPLDPTIAPSTLQTVLHQALAKDPGQRQQSMRAFAADLRRVCLELDAVGTSTSPGRSAPGRTLRRAAAAITLASAAIAAALLWLQPSSPGPLTDQRRAFDLAGSLSQPSFSPDASMLAFVAPDDAGRAQVWIKPLADGAALQVTRGPDDASNPRWSSATGEIVYARTGQGLWSIPPLGGDPRQLTTSGNDPDLDARGQRMIFVKDRRLWSSAADGSGAEAVAGIESSFFGSSSTPALAPDGSKVVYFQSHERRPSGDLFVVALRAGSEPRRLTNLDFFGGDPVWTPDGRWVVLSSSHGGSRTLWRVRAEGGEPIPLTTGAGEDSEPTISADGELLAYTNTRTVFSLELIEPREGRRRTLLERRTSILLPELSPDGTKVAYFGESAEGIQIYVLELGSAEPRRITHGRTNLNSHPRWSSDGSQLYFYQDEPGPSFRRIAVTGGDSVPVANWSWVDHSGAQVGPGDRLVVFTRRDAGGVVQSGVHELATGRLSLLAEPLLHCRWSKDGNTILGSSSEGEVFLCPVDGAACTAVAQGFYPLFAPDGDGIYFVRGVEVWRDHLDGSGPTYVATLDGYDRLGFRWAVLPSGEILWNRTLRAPEIWTARLDG